MAIYTSKEIKSNLAIKSRYQYCLKYKSLQDIYSHIEYVWYSNQNNTNDWRFVISNVSNCQNSIEHLISFMFHMLIQSSDFLSNFLTACSFNSGSLELLSDAYCLCVDVFCSCGLS